MAAIGDACLSVSSLSLSAKMYVIEETQGFFAGALRAWTSALSVHTTNCSGGWLMQAEHVPTAFLQTQKTNVMPFCDLSSDEREHILSFADPYDRHALRATCTGMYGLRAVGILRVPVSSKEALGACHRRQQADAQPLPRVPFWGSTARQLTLAVLDPLQSGDAVPTDQVGLFCTTLAALLAYCPKTIEIAVEDDVCVDAQAVLEVLAATASWSGAWLRLRMETTHRAVINADLCSASLRERLVWCDAAISGTGSQAQAAFPVLQNLCVSQDSKCLAYHVPIAQVFPAARHVHARLRAGNQSVQALNSRLAPVSQNLSSLSLEGPMSPSVAGAPHGERLRLGDQTELSAADHLACYAQGGRVKDVLIIDPPSEGSRWFEASTFISVYVNSGLAASIKTGATKVPELHCRQATLTFGITSQDGVEAAVLLVKAMCRVEALNITAQRLSTMILFKPDLLSKAICAMPKLRTVAITRALYSADDARRLCAAMPASCVVKFDRWHLDKDGVPPRGAVVSLLVAFARTELIPDEPTDWTRRVRGLGFGWPLNADLVARASRLAVVFPFVDFIEAPTRWFEQDCLRDLRLICTALGPRLRCVRGLCGAHPATPCDPEMSRACPWLQ